MRVAAGANDVDALGAIFQRFDDFIGVEHFGGVELAVVPGTLDELHHQHAQALAHGAKRGTERASGLALARPGVNDQESFFFWHSLATRRTLSGAAKRLEFAESQAKGQVRAKGSR